MKDLLFTPIRINTLEIKNRIYLPAMHLGMAVGFSITDQICEFYAERAKGGAGMIVVGNATVDDISGFSTYIGAHSDEYIPGLTKLADSINKNGARSAVQLNHVGRYIHSMLMGGKSPVAPSAIASSLTRETPVALDINGIKQIITSFADAAERVKKSGFDAVEVLNGTGYLISEFLSPLTNKRDDEYGGSLENRMRFGLEVMQAIRKRLGNDYPIIARLDNNDFMKDGMRHEELTEYAKRLVSDAKVDALCVKGSWHEARVPQLTTQVPRGTYRYLAKIVKDAVNVPVIASHRINTPELASELIQDEYCDMVAMGRSFIADPYWPEKVKAGNIDEMIHCIACGQGCFDNIFQMKAVECLCNPKAGYEKKRVVTKTNTPKKIMVIGGGAAGMSAALAAKERGHTVTIFEKTDRLGGQLFLAGAPHDRAEFTELAKDLTNQINKLDIEVEFDTFVDETILDSFNPDNVILATGAESLVPPIIGVDLPHVIQAWDVLLKKVNIGKKVVVIGGGAVGVETALQISDQGTFSGDEIKFLLVNKAETIETLYELATNSSKEVTIIEMMDKIGVDIGKSTKWVMQQEMRRNGIKLLSKTKALEITATSIKILNGETITEIGADTVVLAAGSISSNSLVNVLDNKSIPYVNIGDSNKIGLAFNAVHQGHLAGMEI